MTSPQSKAITQICRKTGQVLIPTFINDKQVILGEHCGLPVINKIPGVFTAGGLL